MRVSAINGYALPKQQVSCCNTSQNPLLQQAQYANNLMSFQGAPGKLDKAAVNTKNFGLGAFFLALTFLLLV